MQLKQKVLQKWIDVQCNFTKKENHTQIFILRIVNRQFLKCENSLNGQNDVILNIAYIEVKSGA